MNASPIPNTRRTCSKCGTGFPAFDKEHLCPYCRKPRATKVKPPKLGEPLTPRQRQVAELVHEDLTDKEIASRLCLSRAGTIKVYLFSIRVKLGVRSRVGVALWVERQQWKSAWRNAA